LLLCFSVSNKNTFCTSSESRLTSIPATNIDRLQFIVQRQMVWIVPEKRMQMWSFSCKKPEMKSLGRVRRSTSNFHVLASQKVCPEALVGIIQLDHVRLSCQTGNQNRQTRRFCSWSKEVEKKSYTANWWDKQALRVLSVLHYVLSCSSSRSLLLQLPPSAPPGGSINADDWSVAKKLLPQKKQR
jgi:hypothetical protein